MRNKGEIKVWAEPKISAIVIGKFNIYIAFGTKNSVQKIFIKHFILLPQENHCVVFILGPAFQTIATKDDSCTLKIKFVNLLLMEKAKRE